MANKKIGNEDIFEAGLLVDTISKFEQLQDILKEQLVLYKELAKNNPLKNGKNLKEYNTALKNIDETADKFDKTQKQIISTQERLAAATGKEGEELAKVRLQLQEQNKLNKELAKSKLGLVDAYEKESKRLIKLRKEYKAVAIEQGANSKEAKQLRREVTKLDKELKNIDESVGQFQRNVGNYTNKINSATKATAGLALASAGLSGSLGDVNTTLSATEEGSEETRSVFAQLGGVVNVLQNRLGKAAGNILTLGKDLAGGSVSAKEWTAAYNGLGDTFTGVVEEAREVAGAADTAEKAQIKLEKRALSLTEEIAKLNAEIQQQNIIAGDSTKSFNQQEQALLRAQKLTIERSLIEKEIAEEELKIINDRIAARADDANNLQLQIARTQKLTELIEIQGELDAQTLENSKLVVEVQRDRFERELDFAIDAFDSQKSVNERRIADETKTFEERAKIFSRTVELTESSFAEQQKLVEGFTKQRLSLNELVNIDDERLIRERLRRFEIDDVTLGRVLEIIREQKIARQDLADLERDLNTEAKENNQELVDLAQERVNIINEIEQTQIQGQIDALTASGELDQALILQERKLIDQAEFEKSLAETTAEEKELIEAKLQNDLAKIRQDAAERKKKEEEEAAEEEAKAAKERREKQLDLATDFTRQVGERLSRVSERETELLDRQAEQTQSNIEKQTRLAEAGLDNQLAFETQKAAEIEIKRQEAAEKEERRQKTQLFLESTLQFLKEGSPLEAVGKAAALVVGADLVAGNFYEGSDLVEKDLGKPQFKGKDGYMIRVDGKERIFNPSQNMRIRSALGDISNEDLVERAIGSETRVVNKFNDGRIVQGLQSVEREIQNIKVELNIDEKGVISQSQFKDGLKRVQKQAKRPRGGINP